MVDDEVAVGTTAGAQPLMLNSCTELLLRQATASKEPSAENESLYGNDPPIIETKGN